MAIMPHIDCSLEEYSSYSDQKLSLAFVKKHHIELIEGPIIISQAWRMKERMKTVSVALVICLNVGVDPPDILKTQPCARLECWIDPLTIPQKAIEQVGNNLQKQYEKWQPRARYKQSLDPTVDDIKKLCSSLRRNAKEERVLFHYNGHGVPKPTVNGEIWVFNRTYTQYIPLSIYDLQTWMGTPSIYVYDCSNAGVIVDLFKQFAEQHEKEFEQQAENPDPSLIIPTFKNCIQLAACSADEILPMNPELPADLFTSCLTTPIKIALRWYVMQNSSRTGSSMSLDSIDKIPGQLNDRRTMLGEMNWIFTAITDTIAWNVLPLDLFQKLFRQDLLVASLFRNFLLAERIMKSYDCTPVSCPKLPAMCHHPMWQAWDFSLDLCLSQLPTVLESEESYVHCPFFEEQLTAFEVWLKMGSDRRSAPQQLPIVLQVLLSQVHRLRALDLLSQFLDLGPWAVNLALSVGIFPYMLKLLQSSARELGYYLVFIWAKILAVDSSCQVDLVRDQGYKYFLKIMQDTTTQVDDRTLAAFAMSVILKSYLPGQEIALQENLVSVCLDQMDTTCMELRLWLIICLAKLWERYDKARWCGIRDSALEKLFVFLNDKETEIRAAAVYALGTLLNGEIERTEHATKVEHRVATMLINVVSQDMSSLVRKELVCALQWIVLNYESSLIFTAFQEMSKSNASSAHGDDLNYAHSSNFTFKRNLSKERIKIHVSMEADSLNSCNMYIGQSNQVDRDNQNDRLKRVSSSSSISSSNSVNMTKVPFGDFYVKIWNSLLQLEMDPEPSVSILAHTVLDYIRDQVSDWPKPKTNVIEGPSSLGTLYNVRNAGTCKDWLDRSLRSTLSVSLPPSPSCRSFISTESPPCSNSSAMELSRLGTKIRHCSLLSRKTMPNMIAENVVEENSKCLVGTKFIEWCSKHIPEHRKSRRPCCDPESIGHFEKEWRYTRNHLLDEESKDECSRANMFRIENQIFTTRCAQPLSLILFHPYDSHFVTPVKDTFIVWDYNSNAKLSTWMPEKSSSYRSGSRSSSRISALEFVNAQDNTMLMVGSEDGCIRLWSDYTNSIPNRDPHLVTAWQALPEISTSTSSFKGHFSLGSIPSPGFRMAWDEISQSILVGGDAKVIRIWDATKELKLIDISTGTDSCANTISLSHSGGGVTFAVGFFDGSIRIFDRRLPPNNCRTITYRGHTKAILSARTRKSFDELIAGCQDGNIKLYDMRNKSSTLLCRTSSRTYAFDVHRTADIFACGGMNQLSAYDFKGNLLNSVRNTEWFMPPKIPSTVAHVAFHPNRVMLGYSLYDSSVVVSSLDAKKWPNNVAL